MAVSVQQEIAPRVAVTVGYFRRSFGNWYTTQNLATSASDYTPFYLTAPLDPRLPGGGGYQVGPIYDVVPTKFGQVQRVPTASSNLAEQTENWNGVDVNVSARWSGLTVQGGTSTGKKYANNCELRAVNPYLGTNRQSGSAAPVATTINEVSQTSPYCDYNEPWLWRTTGLAAYIIPKVDVQVSGTWQSNPGLNPVSPQPGGTNVRALWVVPNAVAQQALGRPLSGGAQNVTVNLIPSGTVFQPAGQPVRLPPCEDPEVRPDADTDRARLLQLHEHRYRVDVQPDVRPGWTVADADVSDGGAVLQNRCAVRLLAWKNGLKRRDGRT